MRGSERVLGYLLCACLSCVSRSDPAPLPQPHVEPDPLHFGGWTHIEAIGPIQAGPQDHVPPAQRIKAEPAYVELTWTHADESADTIEAYKVYRWQAEDSDAALIGIVPATDAATIRDTSVAPETTYIYELRATSDGVETKIDDSDARIDIVAPPENRALVHRWMANLEMCAILGRPVDRLRDYSCVYAGPGSLGFEGPNTGQGVFDMGQSWLVDVFETGCDYTAHSSGCSDGPCLFAADAAPAPQAGNIGDVAYDRLNHNCYVKVASGAWETADALSASERMLMRSNAPGLPPLVRVGIYDAVCEEMNVQGQASQGVIPSRKLFVAASAWDLPTADIQAHESGEHVLLHGGCLGDFYVSGLSFSGETSDLPNNYALLSSHATVVHGSLRTGDPLTATCRSKFGIRDLIGNIAEWLSDTLGDCDETTTICPFIASDTDAFNTDLLGTQVSQRLNVNNVEDTSLSLSEAMQLSLPLVVPVSTDAPLWLEAMPVAELPVEDPVAWLNDDSFRLRIHSAQKRWCSAGGSYRGMVKPGRFSWNCDPFTNSGQTRNFQRGYRCAWPVP